MVYMCIQEKFIKYCEKGDLEKAKTYYNEETNIKGC